MKNSRPIALLLTIAGTSTIIWSQAFAQTTPAQTTRPRNNPSQQPAQQPNQQPNQTDRQNQPSQPNDTQPNNNAQDPNNRNVQNDAQNNNNRRLNRPFTLANPQDAARLDQATERLARFEERMATDNEARLQEVASLRTATGENFNDGVLNVVQQMLRDQKTLTGYLIESRGIWTGDTQATQRAGSTPDLSTASPTVQNPNDMTDEALSQRFKSPFAVDSNIDARDWNRRVSTLTDAERRLESANADRLRRLGEVRGMSGERQSQALVELLQDVLRDQAQMQAYFRDSRMLWSGDNSTQVTQRTDNQPNQNDRMDPSQRTPRDTRDNTQRPQQPNANPNQSPNGPR